VKPDLTCLGKVIGAGLPVGAYGGRKEIMEMVAPQGAVYQAGTLSGNPLAMAGGLAQLRILKDKKCFERLKEMTDKLVEGIEKAASDAGIKVKVSSVCGMLSVFFCKKEVTDFESAKKCDTDLFAEVWKKLLEKGVYWPPSQFEAAFISLMHTNKDLEFTIEAFADALNECG
ncbi:MAG: aminotransferase class III-fold pyridoxal phosphate-dependent enzyme, partial [Candidatus Obscuribacterales bacterium]|nr:aminotransferase class III-fold pyridoxal phosphate-dependent enzyme [Candidatus Obscuribacterales bacterium]